MRFLERLEYWRSTNLPEHRGLELARTDARLRHPLPPDRQKQVDEYLTKMVRPAEGRQSRPDPSPWPDLREVC